MGIRLKHVMGIALVVGAATLSACGDTTSGGGSTTSVAGGGSPGVEKARAQVAKWSATQPPISLPPIKGKVPKNKTVAIVTCPLPVCATAMNPAIEAAKKIGWKVQIYNNPLTPEGYVSLWDSVLQAKPDAIAYVGGLPNAIVMRQLEQAKKLKIPVVDVAPAGDRPSPDGVAQAAYANALDFGLSGEIMGHAVMADGGPGTKAVFVSDKNLRLLYDPIRARFTKAITAGGGKVDLLEVPSKDIGKSAPSQMVNYLRRNPDVKYLASAVDDYMIGVPQALAAAGLRDVKIVGRAPQAANIAALKSGGEFAVVAEENNEIGLRAIDGLIRLMLGDDMSCCTEPVGWHQLLTKENVGNLTGVPTAPGAPAAFYKAWGVSG